MDIVLSIADKDVPDAISGMLRWATGIDGFDDMTDEEKLAAQTIACWTNYAVNLRRERQVRALPEPAKPVITRRTR